jgi:hypothetical protein
MDNQPGKAWVFVERGQRILGVLLGAATLYFTALVNADEASGWNDLESKYEMKRINHQEANSTVEACTNQAESYFSRLRRAEMGHHHHVSGPYLLRYAQESAWREDARRVDNGAQVRRVTELALHRGPSVDFGGYYQRHIKAV